MKYVVGCLAVAAALAAGSVEAGQVSGTTTWNFSSYLVEAANSGYEYLQITSFSTAGKVISEYGYNPNYDQDMRQSIAVEAPINAASYDTSLTLSSIQSYGGSAIVAPKLTGMSRGGFVAIENLRIDIDQKKVYASLTGNFSGVSSHSGAPTFGGLVTTVDNFYLFDYQSLTGPTTLSPGNRTTFSANGLSITEDGYYHILSALRLYGGGMSLLIGITDYGSIVTSIAAVPEPSTYCLALAGIAVVAAVRRKHQA